VCAATLAATGCSDDSDTVDPPDGVGDTDAHSADAGFDLGGDAPSDLGDDAPDPDGDLAEDGDAVDAVDAAADRDAGANDAIDGDAPELWDVPWDDACNPLAMADDCLLPFPSRYFMVEDDSTPTGLRLAYSNDIFPSPNGDIGFDLSIVNIADGVSPLSPLMVNLGVDLDAGSLSGWGDQAETVEAGAPIALIHAASGQPVPILTEMDQVNRELSGYEGRHPLIIRPLAPMEAGATYVVLLRDSLRDVDGNAFESPPVFEALRDGIATDDPIVEAMRGRFESHFTTAESAGWSRDELLLAWDVQIASDGFLRGPARSIREQVLSETTSGSPAYTIDDVDVDPNADVAWLVHGEFTPPSFIDADNNLILDGHEAVLQEDPPSYPFTMLVPAVARERGNLALVLAGHGLFGTGEGLLRNARGGFLDIANDLGAVIVATDWIGLSTPDLTIILEEILGDLGRIRVITDRLVQSHANNLALVELALGALGDDETFALEHDQPLLDPSAVFYYGISLGGIQGASQVALSSRITRGVLAVPGAGWSHLIQRSTQFERFEAVLDLLYPDPLTQNVLITGSQTFFDWSDPGVLADLYANPVAESDPVKVVVLQEAIGDCQVANITTDLLARAMGARQLADPTDPVFGIESVDAPATGILLTQVRVPDDLAEYFPPDANVTPEVDNGVHNSAVLRDNIFEQIGELFRTGEVIHPCDGICDPE